MPRLFQKRSFAMSIVYPHESWGSPKFRLRKSKRSDPSRSRYTATTQSLKSSLRRAERLLQPRMPHRVELVDRGLDPFHPVGLVLEDQLGQEVPARVVVLLVGRVPRRIRESVSARLLPQVEEPGERRTVVLEPAGPTRQRRLAVEDLVVRDVRAACAIPVEEDRQIGE